MMENALDWEHLPFVHASSFAGITRIDGGSWGWIAETVLPQSEQTQIVELILDKDKSYWATTLLSGPGAGMQIHTKATSHGTDAIRVDVRFYLPEAPASDEAAASVLGYMRSQYETLYDEDQALMIGRQRALDGVRRNTDRGGVGDILLGSLCEVEARVPFTVETPRGQVCINRHDGNWLAYSATCPHQLGPLGQAEVSEQGRIECPWHGYGFDVVTGKSTEASCPRLNVFHAGLNERGGMLYLRV